MSDVSLNSHFYRPMARGTVFTNSASETIYTDAASTPASMRWIIPANELALGRVYHWKARVLGILKNGTDTLTVEFYLGPDGDMTDTALTTSAAFQVTANDFEEIDLYVVQLLKSGSSATFATWGKHNYKRATVQAASGPVDLVYATHNLDVTVDQYLYVSGLYSAAHANNQSRLDWGHGRVEARGVGFQGVTA